MNKNTSTLLTPFFKWKYEYFESKFTIQRSFIHLFFLLIKNLILHAELPKPPMFLLPVGGRGGPLPLPLPPEPPGL